MIKPKYKWKLTKPAEYISDELTSKLKLTPIVKKILESKSIIDEQAIESIISDTDVNHDALQLSDMTKAIERIKRAIANDEKILVMVIRCRRCYLNYNFSDNITTFRCTSRMAYS